MVPSPLTCTIVWKFSVAYLKLGSWSNTPCIPIAMEFKQDTASFNLTPHVS